MLKAAIPMVALVVGVSACSSVPGGADGRRTSAQQGASRPGADGVDPTLRAELGPLCDADEEGNVSSLCSRQTVDILSGYVGSNSPSMQRFLAKTGDAWCNLNAQPPQDPGAFTDKNGGPSDTQEWYVDGVVGKLKKEIKYAMQYMLKGKPGEKEADCWAALANAVWMQEDAGDAVELSNWQKKFGDKGYLPFDCKKDVKEAGALANPSNPYRCIDGVNPPGTTATDGGQNVTVFNMNIDFIYRSCTYLENKDKSGTMTKGNEDYCSKFKPSSSGTFPDVKNFHYLNKHEFLAEAIRRFKEGIDAFGIDEEGRTDNDCDPQDDIKRLLCAGPRSDQPASAFELHRAGAGLNCPTGTSIKAYSYAVKDSAKKILESHAEDDVVVKKEASYC